MKTAYRGILVASIALALVAAACGGSEDPGADDGEAAQAAPVEGDCEEGETDPVAAAEALLEEETLSGSESLESSVEVCGVEETEVETPLPEELGDPSVVLIFSPTVLVGEPGQELTIRATNRDVVAHTFTLEEQGIDEVLQPAAEPGEAGDPVEVQVTFPSDGEPVLFFCRFHKQTQAGALVTY